MKSSRHVREVFLGQVSRRRKVDVQFLDALPCGVLDLFLLIVGQLDGKFGSGHGVASYCSARDRLAAAQTRQ